MHQQQVTLNFCMVSEKSEVHHALQGKKRKRSEGFASEHKNEQVAEFLAQLPSEYSFQALDTVSSLPRANAVTGLLHKS